MGLCLFKDDWPQSIIQFDSLIIQIDGIDDQLLLSEQSHFILLHHVKPFLQQKKNKRKIFFKKNCDALRAHFKHIANIPLFLLSLDPFHSHLPTVPVQGQPLDLPLPHQD